MQLDDVMVALESERAKLAALDKKQRKFDQSLAEEKAVSERWVQIHVVDCFVPDWFSFALRIGTRKLV